MRLDWAEGEDALVRTFLVRKIGVCCKATRGEVYEYNNVEHDDD